MPLPSFLQRKQAAPEPRGDARADGSAVEAARTRARRRLIGAIVLLGAGIVVFPLVFETQPRPIATDIPIETPTRKAAGSVAAPPAPAAPKAAAPAVAAPPPDAGQEAPPAAAPAPNPEARPVVEPKPIVEPAKPAASAAKADDGARARALLDDAGASQPSGAPRFVVQVGAYTDAQALREARAKVEKLGFKTYTQVIESDAGRRTRVRVGPFASRDEADAAVAKLKAAGLPVAVLAI